MHIQTSIHCPIEGLFVYFLYFKKEHTLTVRRYCTKVYTVKAEKRKFRLSTPHTHRHSTSMHPVTGCCTSANHPPCTAEKHLKHTKASLHPKLRCSSQKNVSIKSDLQAKQTVRHFQPWSVSRVRCDNSV